MASIRVLRSGRYNVQIRHRGKKPQSKTFVSYDEAMAWAVRTEKLPGLPCVSRPEPNDLIFASLGLRYCDTILKNKPSRSITLGRIRRIALHLQGDVRKITKMDINEYRLMRLDMVAPTTVREELQIIHRIYRWANRELILDKELYPSPCNEVPMPKASKPRSRVVDKDELQRLIGALSAVMASIVELAFETAMRRGEIVGLRVRHIDLNERILSVIDGKTGDRSVPLTTRAVELLESALQRCSSLDDFVYPVQAHSVSTAVRRARKQVGLDDDVRLHQLRHTRITNVAKQGFNQAQIMMVSGHRDVRSVQRYTHLNVKDVVRLLD